MSCMRGIITTGKLMCTLGNHTVRVTSDCWQFAATGKKSIDETTAAGYLEGTYVRREAHAADKSKLGYMPVHLEGG